MSDFGHGHERGARKDYRCVLCDLKIPAGSRYVRYKGKWQGDMQDWPAHPQCYERHDGGPVPYPA